MLSTEGRAPRARRSCYVNEPAYGFFIAGSTIKAMNGVYVRRNPPRKSEEELEVRQDLLYYVHIDSPWTMVLAETPELSDENPYFHRSQGERSEWIFIDERNNDRFTHKGDTIVPGAGVAWKHVHRTSSGARVPEASESRDWRQRLTGFGGSSRSSTQLANAADDDEDELPWQVIAVLDHDILRQLIGGYQYHKEKCEEAVQGRGVVEPPALTSLEGCYLPGVWVYRVVAERGVSLFEGPSRSHASCGHHAEGHYVRGLELRENGKWLKLDPAARRARYSSQYRREEWIEVTGEDGEPNVARVPLADPKSKTLEGETLEDNAGEAAESPLKAKAGRKSLAAEVLDRPFVPRLDDGGGSGGGGGGGGGDGAGASAASGGSEDAAGGGAGGDAESSAGGEGAAVDDEGDVFHDAEEDVAIAKAKARAEAVNKALAAADQGEGEAGTIQEAAASAQLCAGALPVGTAVVVDGLAGADSSKYNGHVGVVISGVDGGRQGVRLEGAPFANKKLHLKVSNLFGALAAAEEEDDEAAAAEEEMEDAKMAEAGAATPKKALARHARALGLTLVDLGLAPAKDSAAEAATDAAAASVANDGAAPDDSLTGFALSGDLPAQRLAAARRCALRDADGDEAESSAAELAHKALAGAIRLSAAAAAAAAAPVADVSDGDAAAAASPAAASPAAASATSAGPSRRLLMSPDARVRHGALGPRVAAAARQAFGGKSVSEMQDGLAELKEALLDELDRGAREQFSLGRGLQDESSDALRLRLVLSLANLESGADTQALEEAREAALAHPDAPAASLVYARCLLRVGKREEALVLLRKAAAEGAATASAGGGSSGGGGVGAKDEGGEEEEDEEEDEEGDDEEEEGGVGQMGESAKAVAATDAAWARSIASPMLRATLAAERRQAAAMDHYERGRFDDATAAYRAALACIEAAAMDDVHCRAALHANIAACLRRDKKQEQAVSECDQALALLPRFGRALFRKAACLLEAARPVEAVEAFEVLYRVDRNWPRLSDWLLRAHAAQRRMAAQGDDASPDGTRGRTRKSWYSSSSSSSAADGGGGQGGSASSPGGSTDASDGDTLSKESDHYVVLGVTCDATDKQIQQAYRMRSLKYHPDRKGGSTAAFQRIAQAFQTLSDPDKRNMYDQGVDIKSKRGGGDSDDSEDDEEENKQSLREEIERRYYPERYDFWPFGDPFINKRKREEKKRRQQGQRPWYDEDY